jgi:hypothetical protein
MHDDPKIIALTKFEATNPHLAEKIAHLRARVEDQAAHEHYDLRADLHPHADVQLVERRGFARRQVELDGFIDLPLRLPIPCRIHNLSSHGALIETAEAPWLPQFFHLCIAEINLDVRCHIIHNPDDAFIGVQFDIPISNLA